ncbi:MAG: hypothetical protein ABFD24_05165 [Anaerolineaceae bacterium]
MNHLRTPPLLIGLAVLMVAAVSCVPPPGTASDVPTEPTASTLSFATQSTTGEIPLATSAGTTSAAQSPVVFSEADCACGGLTVSKAFPWGESIECRYDWSGANVDDNLLGFQLTRDYHVEQWNERFSRDSEDLKAEFSGGDESQVVNEFLTGQDAYGFMTTREGSSRDNVAIAVCGFGKSEEQYAGEWLILTDLRSCEAPNSMAGYLAQFQMVQKCARDLVNAKMK